MKKMIQIKQMLINNNNRPKTPLNPQGIVIHETATPGATAQNEYKYFSVPNRKASAHAFVDWNEIVQIIPWNEVAWHAGRTANTRFIGIELCHATTKEQFEKVWQNAVELFAWLFVNVLKQTKVTKDNLMSHAEVSAKWKETDHTDPVVYFKQYGKTVDDFRADVQKKIDEMLKTTNQQPKTKQGVVTAQPSLNIRQTPSMEGLVIGKYYTGDKVNILEEKGDWYRTDKGWIYKKYVKVV